MKNIYNLFKYFIGIIVIILLVVLAQYFINSTSYEVIVDEVSYIDKPFTNYRVHYIENPFHTEEYMEPNKSYVASLIDYIDIDFDYKIKYDKSISASSKYDIRATIIASDAKTNTVIWDEYKKTYLSKKEISANGNKEYKITESIRINYNEFNNLLTEYRDKNHVNVKGEIMVEFIVNNEGSYEHINTLNSDNKIIIHIPLDENQFSITIDKYVEKSNTFKYTENNIDIKIRNLIIGGILWIIIIALSAYLALSYRSYIINEGEYSRKLRRILNTYDSIIVNVDKLPSLDKINVAQVSEFEELVDAQSEVRLPINFKEDKRKGIAKFVLIRNNLAWVYTLKEKSKKKK